MSTQHSAATPTAASGISGLDDILRGGFTRHRMHLIQGDPGVGKTTLALQFLMAGAARGERSLYVSLAETDEEIRSAAQSHGWDLTGVDIYEMPPAENDAATDNTLFPTAEVDLRETTATLLAEIERVKPVRVAIDSLSEIRLLAQDAFRYRRQIMALKQYFSRRQTTVLLLDDLTRIEGDREIESLVHGVIYLDRLAPEYGGERKRVRVVKLRGVAFRTGYHDYTIERGGLRVYPRLVAAEHRRELDGRTLHSGIRGLDELLGGGIRYGTGTLIVGPAGSGKSTLAAAFMASAVASGTSAALYCFEESPGLLMARAESLGIGLSDLVQKGKLTIKPVDPAELTPGQFAHMVRQEVENGTRCVVIDSVNGYLNAVPGERYLSLHLRELLSYLGQHGVASFMVMAQHGLVTAQHHLPVDVSYLADNVVMLRYFEAAGEVRKAVSVVKMRGGPHEPTIRELAMDPNGISVGRPLREFRGVLTGVPHFEGDAAQLIKEGADAD
jgi:circadian clock protein KaiC